MSTGILQLLIASLVTGLVFLGGCSLPSLGEAIRPPQAASTGLQAEVRALLPPGATLVRPAVSEPGVEAPPAIQQVDLDGDGTPELVVSYRRGGETAALQAGKEIPRLTGVLVARKEGAKYRKVWQEEMGYGQPEVRCADLTGDGLSDVAVGGLIGVSAGNALEVLRMARDGAGKPVMVTLWRSGYHRMDIGDFDRDGRQEVALWSKYTGPAMAVEVYRYGAPDTLDFQPAKSAYAAYFPRVVTYYEEWTQKMPRAGYLWYYLADAYAKAGQPEKALAAVQRGLKLSESGYPADPSFANVKGEALLALGRYEEARAAFGTVLALDRPPAAGGAAGEQAGVIRPDLSRAYYGTGRVYEALGKYEEARKAYTRAGELLPTSPLPERALRRLAVRPAVDKLLAHLASLKAEVRDESIRELPDWARANNLSLQVQKAEQPSGGGLPGVLLVDVNGGEAGDPYTYGAHLICWWEFDRAKKERFHYQVFYSADAVEHGLGITFAAAAARLAPSDNGALEMGVVYETCTSGSGAPIPAYHLYRLEKNRWHIVWRAPVAGPVWRASHGQINFTGPGLEEFTLQGDSWNVGDGKDLIFHEANPGPHRKFCDTWRREADGYRRVVARTIFSTYNTLVEFVWALSTGNEDAAAALVTDRDLVRKAKEAGLVQSPLGQRWLLQFKDPAQEQRGPFTISTGPAAGTTVAFKKDGGKWLMSAVSKRSKPR
ncbi:MAG: tetratricopeptide repeat protein [Bacillota bacterium]